MGQILRSVTGNVNEKDIDNTIRVSDWEVLGTGGFKSFSPLPKSIGVDIRSCHCRDCLVDVA